MMCGVQIRHMGIPDKFVEHGDRELLLQMNSLTPDGILQFVTRMLDLDENARSISKIGRAVGTTR